MSLVESPTKSSEKEAVGIEVGSEQQWIRINVLLMIIAFVLLCNATVLMTQVKVGWNSGAKSEWSEDSNTTIQHNSKLSFDRFDQDMNNFEQNLDHFNQDLEPF